MPYTGPDSDNPFAAPTDHDRSIAAKYPMSYTRLRVRAYDAFKSEAFKRGWLYFTLLLLAAATASVLAGWSPTPPAWPWFG